MPLWSILRPRHGEPVSGTTGLRSHPDHHGLFPRQNTMSQHVISVSDASFSADVLQSDTPVLIDFWAEWCGPCKMLAPTVEEIAQQYQGRLKVGKMNVEENMAVPAQHGIRGIPTLILFKNGKVVSQHVGAAAKSQLTAWIDSNLGA